MSKGRQAPERPEGRGGCAAFAPPGGMGGEKEGLRRVWEGCAKHVGRGVRR
jgi:hypothetical protein